MKLLWDKTRWVTQVGVTAGLLAGALLFSGAASALPAGWSHVGTAGTLGADGVVTASPEGGTYHYISTINGVAGLGLGLGVETDGSRARSNAFTANAGDDLTFFFNFVTSDGAGYADYAWVRLLDSSLNPYATLFTARTTPNGNTVPGFEMPAIDANVTLDPATVEIIPGAPVWSPLAGDSNTCWSTGCGYTGWVDMSYTFTESATYHLEFGVVNWDDNAHGTGLAFDGILVGGVPIDPVAVSAPGTLVLFGVALMGMAGLRRRSQMSE